MLRSLVILGVTAVVSAAVPLAFQNNPALFSALLGKEKVATPASQAIVRPFATLPPASEKILSGRKVRLASDGQGHYTAEFRINGARVEGLVDTGATLVAINRSTARRIGLKLVPADFIHEVSTANGKTRAAAAMIERIEIGRVIVRNVQAAVLDDRALSTTLVGMSFLNRLKRFEAGRDGLLLEQ